MLSMCLVNRNSSIAVLCNLSGNASFGVVCPIFQVLPLGVPCTDHNALKWLKNFKDHMGRWQDGLKFDFRVEHHLKHLNADSLSRLGGGK